MAYQNSTLGLHYYPARFLDPGVCNDSMASVKVRIYTAVDFYVGKEAVVLVDVDDWFHRV